MARQIGELEVRTGALADLGDVQFAAGDVPAAAVSFQAAIDLGHETGDPYYTARALAGSASAQQASGDVAGARLRWQQALDLYSVMGLPEAAEIRSRLGRPDVDPAG